jgi:hypothetical protein
MSVPPLVRQDAVVPDSCDAALAPTDDENDIVVPCASKRPHHQTMDGQAIEEERSMQRSKANTPPTGGETVACEEDAAPPVVSATLFAKYEGIRQAGDFNPLEAPKYYPDLFNAGHMEHIMTHYNTLRAAYDKAVVERWHLQLSHNSYLIEVDRAGDVSCALATSVSWCHTTGRQSCWMLKVWDIRSLRQAYVRINVDEDTREVKQTTGGGCNDTLVGVLRFVSH